MLNHGSRMRSAVGYVAVGVVIAVAAFVRAQMHSVSENVGTDFESFRADVTVAGAPRLGSPDAPIALIEFADFQCAFCVRFADELLPMVQRDYIDKGLVALFFKHMPGAARPLAVPMAQLAECADTQGEFWETYHVLFRSPVVSSRDELHARTEAAPRLLSAQCRPAELDMAIAADRAEAMRLGLTGTPTFLVGRLEQADTAHISARITGLPPAIALRRALDSLIGEPQRLAKVDR